MLTIRERALAAGHERRSPGVDDQSIRPSDPGLRQCSFARLAFAFLSSRHQFALDRPGFPCPQ